MCFIIKKKNRNIPLPKTSRKDIVCWKVLNSNFDPIIFYRNHSNYLNKGVYVAKCSKGKEISNLTPVYHEHIFGYHWYFINEGLHFYKDRERAKIRCSTGRHRILRKFIIPKGTKYFSNSTDIVAIKAIKLRKG